MYDSTTAADIPTAAEMVAGYIDGLYQWSMSDWARFPNATKVRIVVNAFDSDGDVLDVETGDATPQQAPAWVKARQAAGLARPTIYCNLSTIDAVRQACAAAGAGNWDWWAAGYTGSPYLAPGSVATQYADPGTSGGHYDLSLVTDGWPQGDALTPDDQKWVNDQIAAAVKIRDMRLVELVCAQELGRTAAQDDFDFQVQTMNSDTWEEYVGIIHASQEAQNFRSTGQPTLKPETVAVASASAPHGAAGTHTHTTGPPQ